MELRPVKVVIIGGVGVGKTCIAARFAFDRFDPQTETTLGAAYQEKIYSYGAKKSIKF